MIYMRMVKLQWISTQTEPERWLSLFLDWVNPADWIRLLVKLILSTKCSLFEYYASTDFFPSQAGAHKLLGSSGKIKMFSKYFLIVPFFYFYNQRLTLQRNRKFQLLNNNLRTVQKLKNHFVKRKLKKKSFFFNINLL